MSALLGEPIAPVQLGRYQLLRCLGEGGMGTVFAALDPATEQHVALKVLHAHGFEALQRLKREFRVLSDLRHPNLVQFHELAVEGPDAFLAMELVDGEPLAEYVRPGGELDHDRLRAVLSQLVDAVSHLHAHAVLHRDLKPSNLLVTADGRLVVLDFGLARPAGDTTPASGSGTRNYMAPERLRGEPAGEASDWYSVGMIVASALTHASNGGPALDALDGSSDQPANPAHQAWLDLCASLLAPDPDSRPSGATLQRALALTAAGAPNPLRATADPALFVGRAAELRLLHRAFERTCSGQAVIVLLHGEPGIGKTALARRFLAELENARTGCTLVGRCYEGELIPYNAIDGVIEALGQRLLALPESARARLRPSGAPELLRLFPALVPALGFDLRLEPDARAPGTELRRLRELAFAALRELLSALASEYPLVIHLDDLQWGDDDSARLLRALLSPPAPAGLLLIAGFRSADQDRSACVQALRSAQPAWTEELALGALDDPSAMELLSTLCRGQLGSEVLQAISREAAGSPLFLRAMIHVQTDAPDAPDALPGLPALLQRALVELSPLARELLAFVAISGRPIERSLLLRAIDDPGNREPERALSALLQLGFTRKVPGRTETLECYHDRLREVVVAALPDAERRSRHATLAAVAASSDEPDSEFLAYHHAGAGQDLEAAAHAEVAADRAFATLALENAARLYEFALRCNGARPVMLVEKAAHALAAAGRCAEAGALYIEAADGNEHAASLQLRLRGALMLFHAGEMQRGLAVTTQLLRAVGVRLPRSRWGRLAALRLGLLRLRLGRWLVTGRSRRSSPAERLRADICFTLGHSLPVLDGPLACLLIIHTLQSALREAEDGRRARALAVYAGALAALGQGSPEHQDALLARAYSLAEASNDREAKFWVLFSRAGAEVQRTQFARARILLDELLCDLPAQPIEGSWLRDETTVGCCNQLILTGALCELEDRTRLLAGRARDSGNVYHQRAARLHGCFGLLATDAPDRAAQIPRELWRTRGGMITQLDLMAFWTSYCARLYSGAWTGIWDAYAAEQPELARSDITSFDPWSTGLALLRGTVALADAQRSGLARRRADITRCIAQLRSRRVVMATPARQLIEAGLLHLEGEVARSAERYGQAADGFEALSMMGFASAARLRQAERTGGPAGDQLLAHAQRWFEAQRVVAPRRWARMFAPIGD